MYSGPDVIWKFFEHLYAEQKIVCDKLGILMSMLSVTDEQKVSFDKASLCPHCGKQFDKISRVKAKHHCHTTGRFLEVVCSKCNLQLKYGKRKRPDNPDDKFFIPVIAHNMKNYDSHLIIKGYELDVSLRSEISVIPSNTKKFVAFQIGKLHFWIAFNFLPRRSIIW